MFHRSRTGGACRAVVALVATSLISTLWPVVPAVHAQDTVGVPISPTISPTVSPTITSPTPVPTSVPKLKSHAELRALAASYDAAVAEIAKVAGMRLDSPEAIKAAMATIERHRPALKHFYAKQVTIALADPVFVAAAKRRIADERSAIAFLRQIAADPRVLLQLEGGPALQSRLVAAAKTDGEKLQKSAQAVAESSQKAGVTLTPEQIKIIARVGMGLVVGYSVFMMTVLVVALLPVTLPAAALAVVLAAAVAIGGALGVAIGILGPDYKPDAPASEDTVGTCMRAADRRLSQCEAEAQRALVPPAAVALCYTVWLAETGACIIQ